MKISRYVLIPVLISVFAIGLSAQDDPDPNSPFPAIALESGAFIGKYRPERAPVVTLTLSNVEMLPGEETGGVRAYLLQKGGRAFRLETLSSERTRKTGYTLRIRLRDPDGLSGQPKADGESLLYATWRGLTSNPVRIVIGDGPKIEVPAIFGAPEPLLGDDYAGYRWSGDRMRFLEQATFGPTADLDTRIRRIGIRTWLAEQFEAPYPTIPYPSVPPMPTTPPSGCSQATNPTCYRERYSMQPLQQWFFREAFYGEAQLRHRIAWALSQIWVTSGLHIQQSGHMIAYHKILANNAFGNYEDLMLEMTLSPAMGDYLDMIRSTAGNPNENYAREILQLFSIGLFRLNQDGTVMRDGSGNPIPTYDQETVNSFSKIFTGWTYCNGPECPNAVPGALNYVDPMRLNPANHDVSQKVLLDYPNPVGSLVPACGDCSTPEARAAYANASLRTAIANIFNHPNTPPYVSRLLIQQLVTSDPSPAYVARVAGVFADNGRGVRGDLKATVRAILLDPEARGDVKTDPRYGKLREPVQLATNLGRIFPARSWDGLGPTDGGLTSALAKTGQVAFMAPSVFNYFPPDYVIPGTTINAPEFALLNTSLATARTNLVYVLVFDGIAPNATDSLRGISLDQSEAVAAAESDPTGNALLDFLNRRMLYGTMRPEQRQSVLTAVTAIPALSPALRVKQALYLIAASSQYQIQK